MHRLSATNLVLTGLTMSPSSVTSLVHADPAGVDVADVVGDDARLADLVAGDGAGEAAHRGRRHRRRVGEQRREDRGACNVTNGNLEIGIKRFRRTMPHFQLLPTHANQRQFRDW